MSVTGDLTNNNGGCEGIFDNGCDGMTVFTTADTSETGFQLCRSLTTSETQLTATSHYFLPGDYNNDLRSDFCFDGIVNKVDKVRISDFTGSYLYLGAAMDKLAAGPTPLKVGDKLAEGARLPNPSAQQVRAAVTEFCILPLGSQAVKDHSPFNFGMDIVSGEVKGRPKIATPVLIVGPPGTGKKMLVHAVCYETGANLFNLTPSNTDGKYPAKQANTMVHTTFKVAKALAPSVVWIGDVEGVFISGKQKGLSGDQPNRIIKFLHGIFGYVLPNKFKINKQKPTLIDPEDRVLLIGTSSKPYDINNSGKKAKKDVDAFMDYFPKIIYTGTAKSLPARANRSRGGFSEDYLPWVRGIAAAGSASPEGNLDMDYLSKVPYRSIGR